MKITGGTLKGRKLATWKTHLNLRPMTAQTRQSLFHILSPRFFEGCRFLDLFSGTGSLALEALSRGAGKAHAVENHPAHCELIKKNQRLLPAPQKLVLHKKNVFSFLKPDENRFFKRKHQAQRDDFVSFPQKFDIITADPPFALHAGKKILTLLQDSLFIGSGTVLVIETGPGELLKEDWPACQLFKQKSFNDKITRFYEFF